MTTQTELELDAVADPMAGANASYMLLKVLRLSGGWRTRADLALTGFTPRLCRLARQHSKGEIISGQQGYRATSCATMDEILGAANTLEHMGREILAEAVALRARFHKGPTKQYAG